MSDHLDAGREWSPAAGLVACAWVGAVAAIAWCAVLWANGEDPPGRLLAGAAAVGLTVAAVYGTFARPRLRADADGLTVAGLTGRRHHPWRQVPGLRVVRVRRWGRESSLLEIDTAAPDGRERLLVFGRLELAADPEDVAEDLLALRSGSPGSTSGR